MILENKNTLSSYGVVPGVTIHLVKKPNPKQQKSEKKMTEAEIVNSFKAIILFNEFRNILQVVCIKNKFSFCICCHLLLYFIAINKKRSH